MHNPSRFVTYVPHTRIAINTPESNEWYVMAEKSIGKEEEARSGTGSRATTRKIGRHTRSHGL